MYFPVINTPTLQKPSNVDIKEVFVGYEERFGQQQNCQFVGKRYDDNFG
jgi:hypothetical protein